jgi:hypothetical protein
LRGLEWKKESSARLYSVMVYTPQFEKTVASAEAGCRAKSGAAEHLDESSGGRLGGARSDRSQFAQQALPVYRPELVQNYLSVFPAKAYRHSCRIGPHNRGHRSDNNSPQMLVHFIR